MSFEGWREGPWILLLEDGERGPGFSSTYTSILDDSCPELEFLKRLWGLGTGEEEGIVPARQAT
jgi:hypothetical protein